MVERRSAALVEIRCGGRADGLRGPPGGADDGAALLEVRGAGVVVRAGRGDDGGEREGGGTLARRGGTPGGRLDSPDMEAHPPFTSPALSILRLFTSVLNLRSAPRRAR